MSIDLTRRYAVGDVLPTGPDLFELRRLVGKHGTAAPGDVALTAAAVNAALDAEQVEQRLQAAQPGDTFTLGEINAGARRGAWWPAEGPVDWSDPGPADRLQDTVRDVRARRTAGITVPVRVDPDPQLLRITALHAAAQVYAGRAHDVGTETILLAADDFVAWLRDEPLPEPRTGEAEGEAWLPSGDPATDAADRLARHLDAALAEDRVDHDHRPLVRTALAILRRQR